jgi:hypothetical protein
VNGKAAFASIMSRCALALIWWFALATAASAGSPGARISLPNAPFAKLEMLTVERP